VLTDRILMWVAVAAAALAGTAAVVQTVRLSATEAQAATQAKGHAEAVARAEKAGREAVQADLEKAAREASETKEALDAAHTKAERDRADLAGADRLAERLRLHAARLAAICGRPTQGDATTSPSQAASATGDLLAELFGRSQEAAREFADFADRAHAAGLACQRIHEAVSQE
jgi:hypothetical protein